LETRSPILGFQEENKLSNRLVIGAEITENYGHLTEQVLAVKITINLYYLQVVYSELWCGNKVLK
jgi:hypothetical protein